MYTVYIPGLVIDRFTTSGRCPPWLPAPCCTASCPNTDLWEFYSFPRAEQAQQTVLHRYWKFWKSLEQIEHSWTPEQESRHCLTSLMIATNISICIFMLIFSMNFNTFFSNTKKYLTTQPDESRKILLCLQSSCVV